MAAHFANPFSMTDARRQHLGLILLLAFLAAIGPLSVDTYLPSLPHIAKELGITSALSQQSVTSFFFGIAFGQLLAGPLSDRYGRRPVLLGGFGLYFLATIACAMATSGHSLVLARGLQGFAAAAGPSAGRAIIRDLWEGNRAALAMSYVTMAVIVAPLLAPTLGSGILLFGTWRTIFWMLLIFAASALVLIAFFLPETNGPDKRGNIFLIDYFRAYARVLRRKQSWAYLLCGGLSYSAMFAYITGSPFVYIEQFGVSEFAFGLFFGLNVTGLFLGTWINSLFVMKVGYHKMLTVGVGAMIVGAVSLFIVSYFAIGGLWAMVVALFITVAPGSMIGANSTVGLMNLYPRNAGGAIALFGVMQFGLGAVASLLAGLFYTGTPTAMATIMLVAALGSVAAMLWLLFNVVEKPQII